MRSCRAVESSSESVGGAEVECCLRATKDAGMRVGIGDRVDSRRWVCGGCGSWFALWVEDRRRQGLSSLASPAAVSQATDKRPPAWPTTRPRLILRTPARSTS